MKAGFHCALCAQAVTIVPDAVHDASRRGKDCFLRAQRRLRLNKGNPPIIQITVKGFAPHFKESGFRNPARHDLAGYDFIRNKVETDAGNRRFIKCTNIDLSA